MDTDSTQERCKQATGMAQLEARLAKVNRDIAYHIEMLLLLKRERDELIKKIKAEGQLVLF